MRASNSNERGAAKSGARKAKVKPKSKATAQTAARARGPARKSAGRAVGAKASTRAREARKVARAAPVANQEVELEAAVLRRLLRHFDERKDVQNIELMILAGFCRNCLSRWFVEAAQERGIEVDVESARAKIYGMPYSEWKERHQPPATEEQLRRFEEAERRKHAAGGTATKDAAAGKS
jgi:uncharacterized protein